MAVLVCVCVYTFTLAVLAHSQVLEEAAWRSVSHHHCPPADSFGAQHELWPLSSTPSEVVATGKAYVNEKTI